MPQSERVESEPTIWKCGEPYRHPIPVPNEDPWSTLLEPQLKEDRIRCEAWKDEVQTLLIFAGLFSAVVTAFAVQSYPTLQEDPSLILLHRLVERVENLSVNATLSPSMSPRSPLPHLAFTASGSPTRVNILWFLSLILSLTTVLCGIIALQWIREHQRYRDSVMKPKIALAMFRMRSEALESWWVPHLFAGLPLLLLASLVLFFVGMVDFLLSLNQTVALPVTILIILTLLFVAITTCLPTLQLLGLSFLANRRKPSIASQCPYKSPQSWAFHQLTNWAFKHLYAASSFLFHSEPINMWKFSHIPLQLFFATVRGSWINFDLQWLNIRDAHFQNLQGLFVASPEVAHPRRPKYDITSAVIDIVDGHPTDHKLIIAAYHCFHHISRYALHQDLPSDDGDNKFWSPLRNGHHELLRRYYFQKSQFSSDVPISTMIKDPQPSLLHDENMACFLWLLDSHLYSGSKSNILRMHIFELQSRMLAHVFAEAPHISSNQTVVNQNLWSARISAQYMPFDDQTVFTDSAPRLDKRMITSIVEQYFLILHSFIETAASTDDEDIIRTTHGKEIMLLDFLRVPSYLHRYILMGAKMPEPDSAHRRIRSTFQSTLLLIISTLGTRPRENGELYKKDFLFLCSCVLARSFTHPNMSGQGDSEYSNAIITFLTALSKYENELDKERLLTLLEPLMPWSIHSFFDDERRRYIFTPLHQMPAWIRDPVNAGGIASRRDIQSSEKHTSRQQLSNFLPIDGSSLSPS